MRIPLIFQSDRSECAVACLAMVAAFHGHSASLRDFRARFRTSQRGTTLASLRDYAEQLGFKCRRLRFHDAGRPRSPCRAGRARATPPARDPALGARPLRRPAVRDHEGLASETGSWLITRFVEFWRDWLWQLDARLGAEGIIPRRRNLPSSSLPNQADVFGGQRSGETGIWK